MTSLWSTVLVLLQLCATPCVAVSARRSRLHIAVVRNSDLPLTAADQDTATNLMQGPCHLSHSSLLGDSMPEVAHARWFAPLGLI